MTPPSPSSPSTPPPPSAPSPASPDLDLARRLIALRPQASAPLPAPRAVADFVDDLIGCLFPPLGPSPAADATTLAHRLATARRDLITLLAAVMDSATAATVAADLFAGLDDVYQALWLDAEAIAAGDPAASDVAEVIAAYPGLHAIAIHRIAHRLQRMDVPLLPRLLAELAHRRTGIDIHPGATIGRSIFIDHGTGIVIGQTAVVGDGVVIFQGVTLGAITASKNFAGVKRHPTIEDRVVLYANATVLGGDTVIGHDSVIGGNVWLTTGVAPHSFVHQTSQVRVRSAADLLQPSDYSI